MTVPNILADLTPGRHHLSLLDENFAYLDGVITGSFSSAGPTWASYSTIWNGSAVIVGGYPTNQMFGNNAVGIAQGVTGAIEIPSSSAAGNHAAGVAGYAHTLSTSQGAVGTFGFGGIGVNGGSAWGFNTVTTNALSPNPSNNTGFDGGAVYGYELDFNIVKKSGAVEPNVPIRGIYMIGASQTRGASGVVRAIEVDGLNGSGTKIGWLDAYYTADGAADRGINLGSLSVNTGATTSGSQPFYFNSYLSGAQRPSYIIADPFGNILLNPYSGSGVSIPSGSGYQINGTQVVGARDTGWAAMTGTPNKAATYDVASVTLAQLAARVAQLQAILTAHGLIGA